nr:MAG TPA: hypothetical protein [Caudoviricetes sp.]
MEGFCLPFNLYIYYNPKVGHCQYFYCLFLGYFFNVFPEQKNKTLYGSYSL